jgi:hypothetical protein
MKRIFIITILGLGLLSFIVKNQIKYDVKKSSAEVEQVEGVYVFYRSKPVFDYEYLGTYKIVLAWDNSPKILFEKLVRKTKEKYPNAEAIVIDNDMGKCDAIKFKN